MWTGMGVKVADGIAGSLAFIHNKGDNPSQNSAPPPPQLAQSPLAGLLIILIISLHG